MSTLNFRKDEVLKFLSKLKPTDVVTLVGDHGVYLMSFEAPKNLPGDQRAVVYAQGCDPKGDDENWYDNKVELFGGDDGCEILYTVAEFYEVMAKCKKWLHVRLTESELEVLVS